MPWHLLEFKGIIKVEINLNLTLNCGQAFRWESYYEEWRCGFKDFVARIKQLSNYDVYFYSENDNLLKVKNFLTQYFRCEESLANKMKLWASSDNHFATIHKNFYGIRLLRQNPMENLFSFICSSNNNINRITKLVRALAYNFGTKQYIIDETGKSLCYPAFPSIEQLNAVDNLEESLRNLGFGYRAQYIKKTVDMLSKLGGENTLMELRKKSFEDSRQFLLNLSGVGKKVADCVLLGSLDHLEAVPIDIHMFNVMKKHYGSHFSQDILCAKTVTPVIYEKIRKVFNEIWNPDSGWAQLIIFASDLKPMQFEKNETSELKRKNNQEKSGENCKKKIN